MYLHHEDIIERYEEKRGLFYYLPRVSLALMAFVSLALFPSLYVILHQRSLKRAVVASQVSACRSDQDDFEKGLTAHEEDVSKLEIRMSAFKDQNDASSFNSLLLSYNKKVQELNKEITEFERKKASCDAILEHYNHFPLFGSGGVRLMGHDPVRKTASGSTNALSSGSSSKGAKRI